MRTAGLLDVISALPDGRAAASRVRDWEALVEAAHRHSVAPYLWSRLREASVQVPDRAAEWFRGAVAEAMLRTSCAKSTLMRALAALERARVGVMVLKGLPLAERAYGQAELRPSIDVDLLVRPEDASAALEALRGAGGRLGMTDERASNRARHRPHWPPLHGLGPCAVELHTAASMSFGATLTAKLLLDRSREDRCEGKPVRRPAPADEALYLAVHGSNHLFSRLGWLLDLKLLSLRAEVDWAEVQARASTLGFGGAVELARGFLGRVGVGGARPRRWLPRALVAGWERGFAESQILRWPGVASVVAAGLADGPAGRARQLGRLAAISARYRLALRFPTWAPRAWAE